MMITGSVSGNAASGIKYDKNIILYGPAGTGKTYESVIYAVAICDNKDVDEVRYMDYKEIMIRYHELVSEGRIAFTTFHQGYTYEEFVESKEPENGENAKEISGGRSETTGIFKEFCIRAKGSSNVPAELELEGRKVWRIKVDYEEDIQECLRHSSVGIPSAGETEAFTQMDIMEDVKKNLSDARLLFESGISKGDYVILNDMHEKSLAFGIVRGDAKYDDIYSENYPLRRQVKWLVKDKEITIRGYALSSGVPCQLVNASPAKIAEFFYSDGTAKDNYVFIIDEINRGDTSEIFGELLTLIEETRRAGMKESISTILPYSREEFSVPANVYLIGTMNPSASGMSLDDGLRRRFRFIEKMPDIDVLRAMGADKVRDLDVAAMLEKINSRLTVLLDREHTIGHAYFTELARDPSIEALANIFENSLLPLLLEYTNGDYDMLQLILGDNCKENDLYKFILDEPVVRSDIFKGNVDDRAYIPAKKYTINRIAFSCLESYKEIM